MTIILNVLWLVLEIEMQIPTLLNVQRVSKDKAADSRWKWRKRVFSFFGGTIFLIFESVQVNPVDGTELALKVA
jgi:hypothetical protein